MDTRIRLHLNDEPVEIGDISPTTTLLEYLRLHRRACGTKEGCAEGDCGACTVVVIDEHAPGGARFRAVNSCLLLLPLLHGARVYTVEALRERGGAYHPVQERLVSALGSQCGYCTPGVVMAMFEACYREDLDAPWKLDDQLCGNLCRCTGYRPIREATAEIAGLRPDDRFTRALAEVVDAGPRPGLRYEHGDQRFWIPTSFEELFAIMAEHPAHRFVCGATDLGLDVTKQRARFPALISLLGIPALRELAAPERAGGRWRIGAAVRLADLEDATDRAMPPLARMLRFFGARQIKNSATVGGNLCNASPIGDLAPALLALDATIIARSAAGERAISADEFFTGYRQTALRGGAEILARVELPPLPAGARAVAYKVSKRRELDISAVAMAAVIETEAGDGGEEVVRRARFGFGGMAATPARAPAVERALVGRPWTDETCEAAAARVAEDFSPLSDHRGSAWYRGVVAANLVRALRADTAEERVPRLPDRPSGTILAGGLARAAATRGEVTP